MLWMQGLIAAEGLLVTASLVLCANTWGHSCITQMWEVLLQGRELCTGIFHYLCPAASAVSPLGGCSPFSA